MAKTGYKLDTLARKHLTVAFPKMAQSSDGVMHVEDGNLTMRYNGCRASVTFFGTGEVAAERIYNKKVYRITWPMNLEELHEKGELWKKDMVKPQM